MCSSGEKRTAMVLAAIGVLVSGCSMTFDPMGSLSMPMGAGVREAERWAVPPPQMTSYSHPDQQRIGSNRDLSGVVVVSRGDTVYSISRAHGMTPDQLMNANNLEAGLLVPRQRLVVR